MQMSASARYPFDKVTAAVERYAVEHAMRILHSVAERLKAEVSPGTNTESVKARLRYLAGTMRTIAKRNDRFRLLVLSRKVPESFLVSLLPLGRQSAQSYSHDPRFLEAVLTTTNYLLAYGSAKAPVESVYVERNSLEPADAECDDALRLIITSFFHRHDCAVSRCATATSCFGSYRTSRTYSLSILLPTPRPTPVNVAHGYSRVVCRVSLDAAFGPSARISGHFQLESGPDSTSRLSSPCSRVSASRSPRFCLGRF